MPASSIDKEMVEKFYMCLEYDHDPFVKLHTDIGLPP